MALSPARNTTLWNGCLLLVVAVSLAASLHLSSLKPFWQDELFEFYSDARPSVSAVVSGQLHFPFSLEPPAFHVLLHLMQKLPMRPEISTRLPSLLALLAVELSAFFLTLRLTGNRTAALLASVVPLFLCTFQYSAEARVYSLLSGAYAGAFVSYSYCHAELRNTRSRARFALLCCLCACVLLHYLGIVLTLPFLAAEAVRLRRERERDWATPAVVCASLCAVLADMPFLRGLRDISAMYYDSGEARWDMAPLTYVWFVIRSPVYAMRMLNGWMVHTAEVLSLLVLAGCAALLLVAVKRQLRAGRDKAYLLIALGTGLFLPMVTLAIGILKSHAYTPQYSLPAVFCIAVLAGVFAASPARRRWVAPAALLVVVLGACHNVRHDKNEARLQAQVLRGKLADTAALKIALSEGVEPHVYLQDTAEFLQIYFYAPAELRARMVLLQSVAFEWKWNHSAASGHYARNMHYSTNLPVTSWERLSQSREPFLLVSYGSGADWLLHELPADHVPTEALGHALGGELSLVHCDSGCPGSTPAADGIPRIYVEKP